MKIENLGINQFNKLDKYIIGEQISSIECDLYLLHSKNSNKKKLFKKYKKIDNDYFGNKLLTINSLINNSEIINIPELVLPEYLVSINKIIVGFAMRFIENNINMQELLQNPKISSEYKIKWLHEICEIIEKTHHTQFGDNFLLGDIHESNFILDKSNDKVLCVDLDGCKIANNKIYSIKYCSFNEKLFDFDKKYPIDIDDEPIPNINTEWYCFTMILLNTLANGNVNRLMIEDYYDYITFLGDKGLEKDLINCFLNLFTNKSNYSPKGFIKELPDDLSKYSLDEFLYKKGIQKIYCTQKGV